MHSVKAIHIVNCHAEGEVGDVIVGGVLPPPGDTIWEQSRWIARDQNLRNFVLNEPRGGVFRHVNLLVPPKDPRADAAFIIMEPEDTPPMSGSNSICVSTVLLDGGLVPMREPVTELLLEAPGGLVRVRAECRGGKAECQRKPAGRCGLGDGVGQVGRIQEAGRDQHAQADQRAQYALEQQFVVGLAVGRAVDLIVEAIGGGRR